MNNLFFGDERDFFKYALLRIFAATGIKVGVCWMLTAGHRKNGKMIGYLQTGKYKDKDPILFDFLRYYVCDRTLRDVKLLEQSWKGKAIIRRARFFCDPFLNEKRGEYFKRMLAEFADRDLVFFDPDTGIAPKSGGREPDEYLRWSELESCADEQKERSLMIFQYFNPREAQTRREKRHSEIVARLKKIGGDKADVFSLWHSQIAYYFIARGGFKEQYGRRKDSLRDKHDDLDFAMRR